MATKMRHFLKLDKTTDPIWKKNIGIKDGPWVTL